LFVSLEVVETLTVQKLNTLKELFAYPRDAREAAL
jgi:hypothetical protein